MSAVPPIGFTATLTVNDGTSSAQQAFSFPVNVSVPSGEVAKVDRSYLGMSTHDRLYIPGLFDNGQFEFELQYCKVDYNRLIALKGVSKVWIITFPDDGTGSPIAATINGFLVSYPTKFEMEAIPHLACKVQISGAIVVA